MKKEKNIKTPTYQGWTDRAACDDVEVTKRVHITTTRLPPRIGVVRWFPMKANRERYALP
jgi:hypothetical protein